VFAFAFEINGEDREEEQCNEKQGPIRLWYEEKISFMFEQRFKTFIMV
jgi:hypothetical protein